MRNRGLHPAAAVLIALALLVGLYVLAVSTDDNEPAKPPAGSIVTKVDGKDKDLKRDDKLVLSPKAQQVAKQTEAAEDTGDGVGLAQPDAAVDPDKPNELRGRDSKPAGVLPTGGATGSFPGCETRFVRSFSQRTASVKAFAVHYTAGPNLPGYADMNGLTAFANRNAVSWHFLVDREGHCYYSVPLEAKAWTIGNLNSQTVNVEVFGTGREPDYADTPGRRKLAQIAGELRRRYGIPIALGAVSNCTVTRRGIITHWMGGACSGGHIDIKPYSITGVIAQLRAAGGAVSPLNGKERKIVARNYLHRKGHGPAKWRHYWCHKNDLQRAAVIKAAHKEGGFNSARSRKLHRKERHQALAHSKTKRC